MQVCKCPVIDVHEHPRRYMLLCPQCCADVPQDVKTCPNCGAALVEWMPPGPPPSTEELPSTKPLSQIKRAASDAAAEMARARARSVAHSGLPATIPITTAPYGGPRLFVIRGLRLNVVYPLHDGANLIGRRDENPIDIDVSDQEPADRTEVSRQHAIVTLQDGVLDIEDLHSKNGTYVNRQPVAPGEKRTLATNDIVQIGKIQFRVTI